VGKAFILDTSAFIHGLRLRGELITVPEVVEELKDQRSRTNFELSGCRVEEAREEYIREVIKFIKDLGETELSRTDINLLAKALEHKGILVSDDYSIQNVATSIGIEISPIIRGKIKEVIRWERKCSGCGRKVEGEVCPYCGSEVRRKKVKG
jgi:UPF0271 protein